MSAARKYWHGQLTAPGPREVIESRLANYRKVHPSCEVKELPDGTCTLAEPGTVFTAPDAAITAIDALTAAIRKEVRPDNVNVELIERFKPSPFSKFTSGPPMQWLVQGVLPQAGLAVVYGESGSGKSFLVFDIVAALTRGVEWNGRRTKKCKVTYIAAEGAAGFKKRMRAYAMKHGVSDDALLPHVIADSPNFMESEHPAAVTAAVSMSGQTDVIVIDVLAAVMPGGNENASESMSVVIDHCKELHRRTGALVILIHHSGKDQAKGARGWSGLKAAADAEIEVTRKGDVRKFKVSKQKDEADGETVRFKLDRLVLGRDEFDEEESSCTVSFDVKEQRASTDYKPKKGYESVIMDVVNETRAADFDTKELTAEVLKRIPRNDDDKGRDQRDRSVKPAIIKLCAEDLLEVVPGTGERRVRKRGPRQIDDLPTPAAEPKPIDSDPFEETAA